MSEKETFSPGDRIEYMCLTCAEECGHIVVAVGKKGQITRISCPMCGSLVVYKLKGGPTRYKSVEKAGTPYDQKRTYRKGETLTHHMFGAGQVTALIQPHKMDVLFTDRLRRLVCGNP